MILSRRQFLAIAAAAAATPAAAKGRDCARWKGVALGAPARMTLSGVTTSEARPVFARLEAEIARLEEVFSLYRATSAVSRLNRGGYLPDPPAELLEVMSLTAALHTASQGAFDPTVQPLWQALATGGAADAARPLIGWENVTFDRRQIGFKRKGMALTFNGIAQGYVTDRIADMLRREGFSDVLVDIGEVVGLGDGPRGQSWQAGIAMPDGRVVRRLTLSNRALATSAPMAMRMPQGEGHILSPTGAAARHALVSVSAPTAVLADGLSTACCLLDHAAQAAALRRFPAARLEAQIA